MNTKKLSSEPDGTIAKAVGIDSNRNVVLQNYAGWTTKTISLTETDIQTLNSVNGGFGFLIFPSPGTGKIIQIANPILHLNKTNNVTDPNADIFIYDGSGNSNIAVWKSYPFSSYTGGVVNLGIPMGTDTIVGGNVTKILGSTYSDGFDKFLWTSIDLTNFKGTGKLFVDYRVLDIS